MLGYTRVCVGYCCFLDMFRKNGYLCTDVSRRGKNFTAHFSLIPMDVSRFMITLLELLPS